MAQVDHGDGRRKKSKTGEDGSYHTAQVGPGDRGRKKSIKWYGFDLDLIWIGNAIRTLPSSISAISMMVIKFSLLCMCV